ncbi:signal peptidase I [Candidatus Enterococcus mansonii]|uniref:Signal peptidase I n=1 Tax=Candidatus Enterococcus mansonii TaxID=1834181 RepID=A0A242CC45_9ENTE|nr:signal peptidase I [Enterococcus sp. 4G2_DIV0659]
MTTRKPRALKKKTNNHQSTVSRPKKAQKRQQSNKKRKKQRRKWMRKTLIEIVFSIVITLFLIYLVSLFTFVLPQVEGFGMTPVLREPNRIFVNRLGEIKRYSLVYFHVPNRKNEVSTRRIIGMPGEKVVYKEDVLFINDQERVERFLTEELKKAGKEGYQLTEDFSTEAIIGAVRGKIPQGKYLVLGDNRSFATDSRHYGLVDEQEIIGVATMKVLPLHEMMKL